MPALQQKSNLLDKGYPLRGGIRRDYSVWRPFGGFWTIKGLHSNDQDALTKWSGSEKFSSQVLGGKVRGLYQVRLGAATQYIVMAAGKIMSLGPFTVTNLVTGEVDAYYDARVLGATMFMVSGVNPNRKLLSTLIPQLVGIVAPTAAGVAGSGGGTGLTGLYSLKYTFYNSVTGHESDPSPASNSYNAANVQVQLTGMQVSADTQVDKKRIYRTTAGGGIWEFDGEIANALTTYTTAVPDGSLGAEAAEDNGVPPQAKYVEVYNGMLAYAGLASPNESRVAMSGVLRPEAHDPDDVYDLNPEEEDIISGIRQFGDSLAVYKKKALFIGGGNDPAEMDFPRTRVTEGALGNWGIISESSSHFYLSERGPHVFAGMIEEYIGRPIEPLWKTLDLAALENASGIPYKPLNMLIWNIQSAGLADFDQWLIFNTVTKEWTTREHASSKLSVYLDTLKRSKLWIGGVNGYTYNGDVGNADDGTNIACELITRGIALKYKSKDEADLDQMYCFRHVEIHYEPNGGASLVTVGYCMDSPNGPWIAPVNHDTGAVGTFVPAVGHRVKFDLAGYGRLLFLRLTVSSQEPLKIQGIKCEGNELGQT